MYSLELPRWGNSSEYTQHTISWQNKKISLNICFLELAKNFVGTQKWVGISHGKRAIRVWAIEVWLYVVVFIRSTLVKIFAWDHLLSRAMLIIWILSYQANSCTRDPDQLGSMQREKIYNWDSAWQNQQNGMCTQRKIHPVWWESSLCTQ